MNREETLQLWERCQAAKEAKVAEGLEPRASQKIAADLWNEWAAEFQSAAPSMTEPDLPNEQKGDVFRDELTWDSAQPADATFEDYTFHGYADFRDFVFPGRTSFRGAVFEDHTQFSSCQFMDRVTFRQCRFSKLASFSDAKFSGVVEFRAAHFEFDSVFKDAVFRQHAIFAEAIFATVATFRSAKFNQSANFYKVNFKGDAHFKEVQFRGTAAFPRAVFLQQCFLEFCVFVQKANFSRVVFERAALFRATRFKDICIFSRSDSAIFSDAKFKNDVSFSEAHFFGRAQFLSTKFSGDADFTAIRSDVSFHLEDTRFLGKVPSFIESSFRERPRLDNIKVADPLALDHNWSESSGDGRSHDPRPHGRILHIFFRRFRVAPNPNIQARYRVLKALAIGSNDHIQEIDFFAQEMRARRFWYDTPKNSVFWLGLLYEKFSNFGRDILRPLIWWLVLVAFSAGIYLAISHSTIPTNPGTVFRSQVEQISVAGHDEDRGSVTSTLTRWYSNIANWTYSISAILNQFGCSHEIPNDNTFHGSNAIWASIQFSLKNAFILGGTPTVSANDKSAACLFGAKYTLSRVELTPAMPGLVLVIASIESILGTVLIFLSLLGVRNHFRIK